jgi:SAM-dependent methyltransferase
VAIYDSFAWVYARGPYPGYSRRMAGIMPAVLRTLGAHPKALLDVACGEGTFAVAMAKAGMEVVGLDLSDRMLEIARSTAEEQGVNARFIQADMRAIGLEPKYDLATCWYDSLNYLLSPDDLTAAFRGIAASLEPDAHFIFDMNTIYGLAVLWRSQPFCVIQDTSEIFDVHTNSFDFEGSLATKRIVVFFKRGVAWDRIDEEHIERGYSLGEIRACLAAAGLREIACWGSLQDMTEPGPETGRVWFVAKKQTM